MCNHLKIPLENSKVLNLYIIGKCDRLIATLITSLTDAEVDMLQNWPLHPGIGEAHVPELHEVLSGLIFKSKHSTLYLPRFSLRYLQ